MLSNGSTIVPICTTERHSSFSRLRLGFSVEKFRFDNNEKPQKTMSLQLRLEERRRELAQMQRNEGSWMYPMNEMDRQELCPDQILGLEEWDYGSSEDLEVTISDRKILLKEKVSVDHIEVTGTGMLVFGTPNVDSVELRAKSGLSCFRNLSCLKRQNDP